jgi:hypothetical protein
VGARCLGGVYKYTLSMVSIDKEELDSKNSLKKMF